MDKATKEVEKLANEVLREEDRKWSSIYNIHTLNLGFVKIVVSWEKHQYQININNYLVKKRYNELDKAKKEGLLYAKFLLQSSIVKVENQLSK